MWETLREWTIDNPFFRLEWKQWLRRSGPWQILGGGNGLLCLMVLGFHALHALASPFGKAFLERPLSYTMFGALAFVHMMGWLGGGAVPYFGLDAEAKEQRLQFLRLLPGDPRSVLLRIGAARSLLRVLVLISPLPVYLTLGWYGHPPLGDIATVFLLLMLALCGSPSPSEVASALRTAEGWIAPGTESPGQAAATTADPGERACLPREVWTRPLVLAGVIAGLGLLLAAAKAEPAPFAALADSLTRVLYQFLDRNYVLAFVRWVGKPHSFYQGELAPLWVLLAFWIVRGVMRAQEAGEAWARGPELPSAAVAKGEATEKEREALAAIVSAPTSSRALRMYQAAAVPVALFLVLGFFWEVWIQRGSLASWVGRPTAGGSLAALVMASTSFFFCILFEGLRCGREDEKEKVGKSLWGTARLMGQTLGGAFLFVLAAGAAGGVFAVRELLAVAPGLLTSAVAMLLFGWGWRLFRNRWLLGAAGPLAVLLRGLLHGLLCTATYLAPFAVIGGWVAHPLAHRIAALSPIYPLLLQFAPLRTGRALSLEVVPALVGVGLALLALGRKRAEDDPEIGTRDPLLAALTRTAREWDNPLFSMALRRRTLMREHLSVRVLRMPLVMLILSGMGVGFFVMQGMRRSGRTAAEVLEQPSFIVPEMNEGAFLGVSAAVAVLIFSALFTSNWSSAVGGESVGSRQRQQKQDLRLSPLSDVEILRGTLWGCLVEPLPGQVCGPGVSLVWILAALAFGAGSYWLLVWLGAAGTVTGIAWLTALDGFHTWSPKPRRSSIASYLAAAGPAVLMVVLLGFPALVRIPDTAPHVGWGLPLLALVSGGLTFAQVPSAYRRAERSVRESREADGAA